MSITQDVLVGDLVTASPAYTRVLEGFGLDYCCGGRRSLQEACAQEGKDVTAVLEALQGSEPGESAAWTNMSLEELARHIVDVHHDYLWREMPRLQALVEKVARVHGGRHSELAEVESLYSELVEDLSAHLSKEERILFPAIDAFFATDAMLELPFGRLANPIQLMLAEHDRAGQIVARLRAITGDFTPPADGCGSYEAMLAGLHEMEGDLHTHIHKENNVLFPGVIEAEDARLAA